MFSFEEVQALTNFLTTSLSAIEPMPVIDLPVLYPQIRQIRVFLEHLNTITFYDILNICSNLLLVLESFSSFAPLSAPPHPHTVIVSL